MLTECCSKSGQGTPMYSRRGKSTINQYLCFSREPIDEEAQIRIMAQKKYNEKKEREKKIAEATQMEDIAEQILSFEIEEAKFE